MKVFQPKLFSCMKNYNKKQFVNDLIAGIIVAIIALPLSIALAIASGVGPERGIFTAIIAGFVISFLGGSRVNISGPTAAFATIVAGIVVQFGMSGLIVATIMAGIMLVIMGIARLGALIKFIPYTITTGFTAGIAVTIVIGQIKDFLGLTYADGTVAIETVEKLEAIGHNISTFNPQALIVGIVGLVILFGWPKINKKIPSSLIAVIVGIIIVKVGGLDVNTIGDLYTIPKGMPSISMPSVDFNMISQLLPSAFTIAILAAIESLLSCVVSDGMVDAKERHNSNTELIAQGVGNIFSGLFGGIPATGAIARTAANVNNGGRTPIAGIIHAGVLFIILMFLMPFAEWIPMPIIAAILFQVAYNMCGWKKFRRIVKDAPKMDIAVLLVTFALTVVFDLVVAIEVGMILAVVLFMKRMADVTHIRTWTQYDEAATTDGGRLKDIPEKTAVYEIEGPMFFATADKIDFPIRAGMKVMILRMRNVPSLDVSAIRPLRAIYEVCEKEGVHMLISHANEQPFKMMEKDGLVDDIGRDNYLPNIDAALARAREIVENNIPLDTNRPKSGKHDI